MRQQKKKIFEELKKDYISGITFSGGDPLHPLNREEVGTLIREIKEEFPDKTIWLYTGFVWETIQKLDFMPLIDVVIDGEYIEELRDVQLKWKGSSNQRVIDVKHTLKEKKVVLKYWD